MTASPPGTVIGHHNGVTFTVRGHDCLELLEPLWLSLFDHHRDVGGAGFPTIAREKSWPYRRHLYEKLFVEPDTFVVLAARDGHPVGYSMNHTHRDPDDTWPVSDITGEIETLALLPEARGEGVGTALMDVSEEELSRRGAITMVTAVLEGNERALDFYLRRGMTPTVTYLMRLGPRPE